MSNTSLLGAYGGQAGDALMFRNVLINGCFRVWQRGTSQTSAGYGSADRWVNDHGTSTKTTSRQTFTPGQTDVPGEPETFIRTVVTSGNTAGSYVWMLQRIEDVRTLAGRTATISFWAKADANKNMSVQSTQVFGSGGSSAVELPATKVTLTTAWKYYTVTVTIPSISGKTIGTDSHLRLAFWFDAGIDFNSRTDSLGNQSGTFDLAQIQLESGAVATPFERRPIGTELALCQRYYYKSYRMAETPGITNSTITYLRYLDAACQYASMQFVFPVTMRIPPVGNVVVYNTATGVTGSLRGDAGNFAALVSSPSEHGVTVYANNVTIGTNVGISAHITANAEL